MKMKMKIVVLYLSDGVIYNSNALRFLFFYSFILFLSVWLLIFEKLGKIDDDFRFLSEDLFFYFG